MAEIADSEIKEIENELRDIMNWISVFETEYNLPKEVVVQLKARLEDLAEKIESAVKVVAEKMTKMQMGTAASLVSAKTAVAA